MNAHGGSYHPHDRHPRQQYVQPRGSRQAHDNLVAVVGTCIICIATALIVHQFVIWTIAALAATP